MRKIFCVATDTGFSDNDGSVGSCLQEALLPLALRLRRECRPLRRDRPYVD